MPGRVRGSGRGPEFFQGAAILALIVMVAAIGSPAAHAAAGGIPQTAPATNAKPAASSKSSNAKKKKKSSARPMAPEPARIREIQQALAREGYYHEEPTGKWDESSVAAMKEFQTAKGLPPTGKLEALSLQKLGLGSPVAGVAPPEPRPPAGEAQPASTKPPHE